MARALWKGSIAFGLVNIPVELHTAVRDHRPRFRMLHASDKSPIQFTRVCAREGKPVALSDIHTAMFVVGTVRDHVAPWKSTYKIHYQVDADVTYLLTSGGHNAGVVAPPGEQGHFYQVKTKAEDAPYIGPDEWLKVAPRVEGSWWPEWSRWQTAQSGDPCEPPGMGVAHADGRNLPDAPGDYVRQ